MMHRSGIPVLLQEAFRAHCAAAAGGIGGNTWKGQMRNNGLGEFLTQQQLTTAQTRQARTPPHSSHPSSN